MQSDYDSAALALSGIQHYWKLTETSGTSAADSQGSTTLTWGAAVSGFLTTGPDGVAQVPVNDGSTTKVAINSTGYAPSATASYFWWQRQDVDATGDEMIFELNNSPAFTQVVQGDYGNSGGGAGAGKALFGINYGNATASAQVTFTKGTIGQWDLYALVMDVTQALGSQIKVYKNTTLISTDITGAGGSQAALTPATMKIGVLGRNNNGTRALPIKAAMCGFGTLNRVMTTAEMQTLSDAMLRNRRESVAVTDTASVTTAGTPIVASNSAAVTDTSALAVNVGHGTVAGANTATRAVSRTPTLVIAGGGSGTTSAHRAFPSIVEQSDGTLRVIYRRGTSHGSTDAVIATVTSTNEGATWSSESVIFGAAGAGTLGGQRDATQGAIIRRLRTQRLGIAFCQWASGTVATFPTGAFWRGWYMYSDDNGATWSTPVEITFTGGSAPTWTYGTFVDGFTELDDGSLLASCYALNSAGTSWTNHVSRSTDGGATWTYRGQISGLIGGFNTVETSLVQLRDGRVMATFHTEDGAPTDLYQAYSSDRGATWTTPVAVIVGTSQNFNFAVQTLDGDIVQAFYDTTLNANVVRQSWDNGFSYGSSITVESATTVHPTLAGSLWVAPCNMGHEAVTPNVALAMGWENLAQTQADIYYASLTRGLTAPGWLGDDSGTLTDTASVAAVTSKSASDSASVSEGTTAIGLPRSDSASVADAASGLSATPTPTESAGVTDTSSITVVAASVSVSASDTVTANDVSVPAATFGTCVLSTTLRATCVLSDTPVATCGLSASPANTVELTMVPA